MVQPEMSGINASFRIVWAKMRLIGRSSGSFLSPSTYMSMTVIKRKRGEENGEGAVERK